MGESKFLSDEEYDLISKMMEAKGYPKFHLIAFNTDEEIPKYLMASGLGSYHDLFILKAVFEIVLEQVKVMCDAVENHGELKEEDVDVIKRYSNVQINDKGGNC
jgi:hypothetical protein